MFLRIEPPHRPKFEVPYEVLLIFEFLSDASPPPSPRIALRVIRRRGVPSARSRSVSPARNQALLPGAPLSLAAVCCFISSLRISPFHFVRFAPTASQFTPTSYVLAAL